MRVLLLLAGAFLLAGCATTVTGAPRPVASHAPVAPVRHIDPDHVTAKDALGDITTVSPCSLMPITDLPSGYGPADIKLSTNIDDCQVYAPNKTGGVYATVGILEDYTTASRYGVDRFLSRSGGMRIGVLADNPAGCVELLLFADNVTMNATVWPADKNAKDMCKLATALLDHVIKVVTGKGPRHRDYHGNTLAREDACQVLTADDAELVPGAGTMRSTADFPAHHRCNYEGSGAHRTRVLLDFRVYDPTIGDDEGESHKTIAQRDTVIVADPHPGADGSTYCVVITVQQPIEDAGLGSPMEAAEVSVRVEGGGKPPCDQAERVAAAVWLKLPGV